MNKIASTVTWRQGTPALAPPPGFRLGRALGLTYSLDLTTLDASIKTMGGTPDQVAVVCQASRLRTGSAARPEHKLLDRCVRTIALPEGAFFHPKVWLLKFAGPGAAKSWRLIVGSLNISETPDAFEVSVVLEGESAPGAKLNGELISFLRAACPEEAWLDELAGVRFFPPAGFTGWRFAAQRGLPYADALFPGFAPRAIVSPALDDAALLKFLELAPAGARPLLVSTQAGLDSVHPQLLGRFDARLMPDSAGLHAKAVLGERELWLGSANAKHGSWFGVNAECMIVLEGGDCSLESLLARLPGLAPYRRLERKARDPEIERYLGFLNRAAWSVKFANGRAEIGFETGETNPRPATNGTVGLLGHPARRPISDLTGTGRLTIDGVDERARTEFLSVELPLENPARVSRFLMRPGYFRR